MCLTRLVRATRLMSYATRRDAKPASQEATRRDVENKATRLEVGLDASSGQDRVGRLKAFYSKGFVLKFFVKEFEGCLLGIIN